MFGSTILDVAIGMIFVYLLLSLLCSAIKEYIEAKWLKYRSQNLWMGIQLLLNGAISKDKPDLNSDQPLVTSPPAASSPPDGKLDLASLLYQHGLVRALFQDEDSLPSYIPSRTFALALWNLAYEKLKLEGVDIKTLKGPEDVKRNLEAIKTAINDYIPNRGLSQALITLIDEADGDFDRALKNIEDWYDAAMDRVSGWYKRHTQWVLLGIGFAVAIFINADSVNIARALLQDKTLRDAIVANSKEFLLTHDANGASNSNNANSLGTNSNAANSNAANVNANAANANIGNANAANTSNENARRGRDVNTNAANVNSVSTNSNNSNSANSNSANSNSSNSNSATTTNTNAGDAAATTPSTAPSPTPESAIQKARADLDALGLPLGWAFDKSCFTQAPNSVIKQDPMRGIPQGWKEWCSPAMIGWLLLKLFGLFMTGLAVSQGAPFWFDLLNKFMVIRSTVKPKEKSPDEASKDKTSPNPKRDTHDGASNSKT